MVRDQLDLEFSGVRVISLWNHQCNAGRISRVQCAVRRWNSHHGLWNQGRGMAKPPAAPLAGWQLVLHGLASQEVHRQFAQH
jgi:hypothetical protein